MEDSRSFADLLRRLRIAAVLSQRELAERAGISERAVSDLERGVKQRPHPATVRMIADGLGLADAERSLLMASARPAAASSLPASGLAPPPGEERFLLLPPPPALPGALIGRDREMHDLESLLKDPEVRLVTLLGPGGIGKTRLSLEAGLRLAGEFPDGVLFVDLAPMRDPALVMPAVAAALGLPPAGDAPGAIAAALRGKRALLLLDNLEQVTDAGLAISALLAACAGPNVLVTSRIPLRLRWEWVFPVEPLATPQPDDERGDGWWDGWAALRLFETRARSASRTFALDAETASDVAAICRRVDGLPLAIELAAARTAVLPPAAILGRLDRRLPLLSAGARDLPERQQTMHNAIAWGFDLLPDDERDLARRLSVFNGGFPLSAACAVHPAADDTFVIDRIGSLNAKQIVRRALDGDESDPRFTMLDTIREFARDEMRATGSEQGARAAHLRWALDEATRAMPHLDSPEADTWLDRLDRDRLNVHEAIDWAISGGAPRAARQDALRLCAGFSPVWLLRGHWQEGIALTERAIAAAEDDALPPNAAALLGLGKLLAASGRAADARKRIQQAHDAAVAQGDDASAASALLDLAAAAEREGDDAGARAAWTGALDLAQRAEEIGLIARARAGLER